MHVKELEKKAKGNMLKSQLISVCFLGCISFSATASVLLPFSSDIPIEKIEQTDVYAMAEDGYDDAQFRLAVYYESQKKKDYPTIVRWLRKSAMKGNLEAQYALGKIYQFGKPGILQDLPEAEFWYEKAAAQGDKQALQNLDIIRRNPSYRLQSAPDIDEKWDIDWTIKTAGYGDPQSQYDLGRLYQEGKKLPMNYTKALAWYYQAASKGHIEAMTALAYLYLEGKGTEVNVEKAVNWYEKAAQTDYIPAQLKLYEIYSSDTDKLPELVKAYKWLYLSLAFVFPNVKDLTTVSPELEALTAIMSEEQLKEAQAQIQTFIQEKRQYVVSR